VAVSVTSAWASRWETACSSTPRRSAAPTWTGRTRTRTSSPAPAAPTGSAVDSGHVYWTNIETIGRADLDGQNPNQSFITGASGVTGVAVDSGHVYWTNSATETIGRADLDGQNANQSFITTAGFPYGLAVGSGHVYWTDEETGTIGRADLDGLNASQTFITGAIGPFGVAVDSGHVYWANNYAGTIARARGGRGAGPSGAGSRGVRSAQAIGRDDLVVSAHRHRRTDRANRRDERAHRIAPATPRGLATRLMGEGERFEQVRQDG
jgi:hypothetical protein